MAPVRCPEVTTERRRDIVLIATAWMVIGGALMLVGVLSDDEDYRRSWRFNVLSAVSWLEWSILTPLIVLYIDGTPHVSKRLKHVAGAITAPLLHLAMYNILVVFIDPDVREHLAAFVTSRLPRHFVFGIANYSLVAIAAEALAAARGARRSEIAAAEMSERLARAELDAVRLRLRPLHIDAELEAIQRTSSSHPAEAERRIYDFTSSLRELLRNSQLAADPPPRETVTGGVTFSARHAEALAAAAFAGFGVYANMLFAMSFATQGVAVSPENVLWRIAGWLLAGAAAPLLVRAARRAPDSGWMRLPALVAAIVLFAVFTELALPSGILTTSDEPPRGVVGDGLTLKLLISSLVVYFVHFVDFAQRRHRAAMDALELSQRLAAAQLQALRAQLRPHFLFNALTSAITLLRRNPEQAATMMLRLRHLLRMSVMHQEAQEVALADEMEIVESYIAVERARLQERLAFDARISPAARSALVPPFVLQPLVENAVRHGISQSAGGGGVVIRAWVTRSRLMLEVEDDGAGIHPPLRSGIGLTNIRSRLTHLYGADDAHLTIDSDAARTVVRLDLPLRQAAA